MLKTFRRMFFLDTPVELEVRPEADAATAVVTPPPSSPEADAPLEAPALNPAEAQLISQLARLEPLAGNVVDRLEHLDGSERAVASAIEAFHEQAGRREVALREAIEGLRESGERHHALMGALQGQLEEVRSAHQALADELRGVGADFQELTALQKANVRNGRDLVEALQRHTDRTDEQMKLLGGVGIAMVIAAGMLLVAAVVVVLVAS